jgi:predicted Zn-dependent protease
MKKLMIIGLATGLLAISSCSTVPLTGRSRLSLIDDSQLQQQAAIGYAQLLSDPSTKVVSTNSTQTQMVKRVGAKIAAAVTQYMNQNGYGAQIQNYKWEFNLIESKEINAWCMPGGKVAVYTGILPITKDEAGLATVMGHENRSCYCTTLGRKSFSNGVGTSRWCSSCVATSNKSETTQAVVNQLYGIGGQLTILKYGRNQEFRGR